jgi:surface protein
LEIVEITFLTARWDKRNTTIAVKISSMDVLTIVLVEKKTILPLDLVVLINSFLYKKLTDENFKEAIARWFEDEEDCKWRFGHISDWNTSRVTNMKGTFYSRERFNQDISRWNVSRVTNMSSMFLVAARFSGDVSQWNVENVTTMKSMFQGAKKFNGDISEWNVRSVTDMSVACFLMHYNLMEISVDGMLRK